MNVVIPLILAAAAAAPVHRVAIVVGANKAAAGRAALRYSYDDARSVAGVLVELGQFAPADVTTLEDPDPDAVLQAVDSRLAELHAVGGESLLLFYYSGHADQQALYPNGKRLPYAELRRRLDAPLATMRIGIIDACSGGGWTQSKGLHPEEPFDVGPPLALSSEGSVLIASSSGVEKARESESIGGSFFTHHLVAGLRGAADRSGDGRVTLTEAFEYARELTIRDSALSSEFPQHPSFAMNLRGRGDVTLTSVDGTDSTVVLTQSTGPLQLIHLETGLIVLEAPVGPRALRLAVAPGRYLVRRRTAEGTFAREITVEAGKTTEVREETLELVGRQVAETKEAPLDPTSMTVPWHHFTLHVGVEMASSSSSFLVPGSSQGASFSVPVGLYWHPTDRLQVSLLEPAIRYVFGDARHLEWIVNAGLTGLYWGKDSEGTVLNLPVGAELTVRKWLGHSAVHFGLGATVDIACTQSGFTAPNTWSNSLSLGYSYASAGQWSTDVSLWATRNLTYDGAFLPLRNDTENALTASVSPSLRFRLSNSLSANAGVTFGGNAATGQPVESVSIGLSWSFL